MHTEPTSDVFAFMVVALGVPARDRPRGQWHHRAVLTDAQIEQIRVRRAEEKPATLRALAAEFKTHPSTIWSVCSGRTRKWR